MIKTMRAASIEAMSDADDPYPEEERRLRYSISLMIKHPSLDPARVSQELGIAPKHSWAAGEPRKTPAGTPLPGRYPNSYWVTSEVVRGERRFFDGAVAMLERLEAASDFIRSVTDQRRQGVDQRRTVRGERTSGA